MVDEEQDRRTVLETELEHFLLEEPEETDDSKQSAQEAVVPEETKEELTLYTGLPEES